MPQWNWLPLHVWLPDGVFDTNKGDLHRLPHVSGQEQVESLPGVFYRSCRWDAQTMQAVLLGGRFSNHAASYTTDRNTAANEKN